MAKTKISEYSTTNSSNSDIEGINIAEGCAPSGINNAIREVMVHLKNWQTNASGDGATFANLVVQGTGAFTGAVTMSAGATLSGTNTLSGANIISGNINSSGTNTFSGSTAFSSGTLKLQGSSSGTATLNAPATAGTSTYTLPNTTTTLGFQSIPPVGTKSGSYTLQTSDVGKYVQVTTGGSITIPTSTFAEGDIISIFNNTTGNITITCSAPTTYAAGINSAKTSLTLSTRGVATILFISSTICVVTGNVL